MYLPIADVDSLGATVTTNIVVVTLNTALKVGFVSDIFPFVGDDEADDKFDK